MLAKNNLRTQNFQSLNNIRSYQGKPVAEIIVNGFFNVDENWTVKYWNKAAEQLLGIKAKEIINKNIWKQFDKLIPPHFLSLYQDAKLNTIPAQFLEYWPEKKAWFDVNTWCCDDLLYVSFKSSDQHPENAEKQPNISADLYRFVTEITNDCLWEWDLNTNEVFWIDGGHKRVFGYPIENTLVPISFWKNCIHPDDKVRVLTKLNQVVSAENGRSWEDEYRFKNAKGNYIYVHDRGHIVYDENHLPERIIGATQDINDRVLLTNELAAQKLEKHKEITGAVLTAQESERANIGKELHDNLGQVLAVALMSMQMAKRPKENKDSWIDKSLTLVRNVMNEIRKISKTLVIPEHHIISLLDNIQILVNDVMAVHPIKIDFLETDITDLVLNDSLQVTIFRVIQEQVNNILKHSNATHASILLSREKSELTLVISDNGRGADLNNKSKGVGIINIRSRVDLHHGTVTIVSEPGKGFKVKVVFSLNMASSGLQHRNYII